MENKVVNTQRDEATIIDAFPGAIEAQEARGQRQLVESSVLPMDGDWDILEMMGVKRLGPVSDDPLFVHVELPEGWRIRPTEHSMNSYLVDAEGQDRAHIFYKAAFYDRKAHIRTTKPLGEADLR